jgi:subtilisin-like proprotein convertase family protein
MKREINLFRAPKQIYRLREIVPTYNINILQNPLICILILMIPLLMPVCFVNVVYGEVEENRWGGMIEINSEYSSDDVPKEIPDFQTVTSTLVVTESGPIVDLNVKLNINHTYDGDLDIYLIAPDNTHIELFTDVGGSQDNFIDTIVDNEAGQSINEGSAPFTGSYRPEGNLADLYGKEINGTWKLEVGDDSGGSTGVLNSWSLIAKLQVLGPVPSPVIMCEPSLPEGICDTIFWNDVGEICKHESSVSETIPDEGTMTSTIVIDDEGTIEDLNVKVNISHDWDSELDVYLIAPDDTRVELFTDVGGSQDDFNDTILDDQALQAITEGSAPFTGSYRPEESLDALIGKDINGSWALEITDDSWFGSGTLNSWSLTIDKADILYYAECSTDPDFDNIASNSGWMSDRSYTFTKLDANQEYWYRTKARPLMTWSQTSQEDFDTDTLSDTKNTIAGDVLLAGGGDFGLEVDAIENPSMELDGGWGGTSDNLFLYLFGLGYWPGDFWSSDGDWVIGVEFFSDFYYSNGETVYLVQQDIDWTEVDTLVFDYCSFLGTQLKSTVFIGDQEVWSHTHSATLEDDHYDITVDVSNINDIHDLILQVEIISSGSFDASIYWDNFRTYGASGSVPSGSIVSAPIILGEGDTWEILEYKTTVPEGTGLTVDVLPETGSTPITGYEDVPAGTDLSGLGERTIRLRANLSTSDPEITPVLHDWSITYTDASYESEWSNVESSLPKQ